MMVSIPGYCTLCRSRCGAMYHVEGGHLAKVTPLSGHPTGGALCAKGRAAPELVASPERLRRPLKRTRNRGSKDPGWVSISWDEALDEIAEQLQSIRSANGPEAVAFAVTTPSGSPMVDSFEWVERFVRCFGSPNLIYAVEVCGWHKDYAHALTFGRGIGTPDFDRADVIVMWGHNPARTWLAQASRISDARKRGACLVTVDPKRDGTGQQADLWLPIRPGADGALAMGAIRHLIFTDSYDADFARTWTNAPMLVDLATGWLLRANEVWSCASAESFVVADGNGQLHAYDTLRQFGPTRGSRLRGEVQFDDKHGRARRCKTILDLLAAEAAPFTVEQVARVTWVEQDLIERFNTLFSGAPKIAYYTWTGVGQHTNATMTERAIATLYALTGACDKAGGNVWTVSPPFNSVNDYSLLSAVQRSKALGLEELPLGPPSRGWITARDFSKAVLESKPYPVKALMSFGANFSVSQGDTARNRVALQELDFHVHVDTFMNPTAENADIVLPANMPWERRALKFGFEVTQSAVELVQLRPRILPQFHEARADYDIVFALAKRLGLADEFFGGDIEAGWNYQLAPLGTTVEDLRSRPEGIRFQQPFRHKKYSQRDAANNIVGFATPSRRVEIYSEALLEKGQPPLACYVEPAQSPLRSLAGTRYPLVLTTAKSGWFVHSSYRHIAALRKRSPDPTVQIGPGLAKARGVGAGDWVLVRTSYGSARLRARIDEDLDDRVIIAEFGWWAGCHALGRRPTLSSEGPSNNVNDALSDADRDPISGSVALRATLCDIAYDQTANAGRWSGERPFEIVSRRPETHDTTVLGLAPLDGQQLPDFLPGQHVTVSSPKLGITRRYSLIDSNRQPEWFAIAVKRSTPASDDGKNKVGQMSGYLNDAHIGETLMLGPPEGVFTPPLDGSRPIVLMANGIGITPFAGYLEALFRTASNDATAPVIVVHVCRNGAAHVLAGRLRKLAAALPQVTLQIFYSSPRMEDRPSKDYDRAGRPNFDFINLGLAAKRPLVYLCGSASFVNDMRARLSVLGVPAFDVFSEAFSSDIEIPAKLSPQKVHLVDDGQSFVWSPRVGTLLDGADAAGVALSSGCRVGQCESCAMHIISGAVAHLTPYGGPDDQCLTCQAVPLTPLELMR